MTRVKLAVRYSRRSSGSSIASASRTSTHSPLSSSARTPRTTTPATLAPVTTARTGVGRTKEAASTLVDSSCPRSGPSSPLAGAPGPPAARGGWWQRSRHGSAAVMPYDKRTADGVVGGQTLPLAAHRPEPRGWHLRGPGHPVSDGLTSGLVDHPRRVQAQASSSSAACNGPRRRGASIPSTPPCIVDHSLTMAAMMFFCTVSLVSRTWPLPRSAAP